MIRSLPNGALALVVLAAAAAAQDADATTAPPLHVQPMGVLVGLQYDTPRFAVAPGQPVAVDFHNRDEMAHNFVLVKPGRREAVVAAALALGAKGPDVDYVPDTPDVLHATAVLDPGEAQRLTFKAPTRQGVYPYVCTFPGHGVVMYGAMYVGTRMPDALRDDPNVSPMWRNGSVTANGEQQALHAWSPNRRPLIYRVFLPDASPAAIAIALSGELSVAWDATPCRLRYAWRGGFVDPWPVWKGNGNGLAKILGERFAVAAERPFRLAGVAADAPADFRGYRLVDGGFPEFEYGLGDATVRELVRTSSDGGAVRRVVTIDGARGPVEVTPRIEGTGTVTVTVDGNTAPAPCKVRPGADGTVQFVIDLVPPAGSSTNGTTGTGTHRHGDHGKEEHR